MNPPISITEPILPAANLADLADGRPGEPSLLVSVQDCWEARLARSAGVRWIDLKDTRQGALGAPDPAVAAAVAAELADHPQRSVAGGELLDATPAGLRYLAGLYPIVKLGTAGTLDAPDWPARMESCAKEVQAHRCTLVPAAYADAKRVRAVEVERILACCAALRLPIVLIDTAVKDGSHLLDWMSESDLRRLVRTATQAGIRMVAAGSLRGHQVDLLRGLPLLAIGVRGMVCGADRNSRIEREKLQQLVAMFQNR